ncbi:hypothetical protein [Actinoplanes couchii]|nr:hypothetical protein [Actinoplanes couchii]MDR6317439.1 hypothetical protein [Actinoplanes couchii]
MPHLSVHAPETDLTGNEPRLIAALTEAVVAVYGDWARPSSTSACTVSHPAAGESAASRPAVPRRPSRSVSRRPRSPAPAWSSSSPPG